MASVVVLLPPSEGKAEGGRSRWSPAAGRFRRLVAPRRQLVAAVADMLASEGDLQALTGTKGVLYDRARRAWAAVAEGRAPVLPAWRRFTGVVWEHLDPASLEQSGRERILVVNGLTGLAGGLDPVPDFRLKMDTSVPVLGRIDRFWLPHVNGIVTELAQGSLVINLLPMEHDRALGPVAGQVKVRFVAPGGGQAGHLGKAVKGTFSRFLLQEGVGHLGRFAWKGWTAERQEEDLVVVSTRP
jgi:cytoplasmic iron level regulating protein YaaA (DUF328/UPF0246 family)